jgi:hypothetical protein
MSLRQYAVTSTRWRSKDDLIEWDGLNDVLGLSNVKDDTYSVHGWYNGGLQPQGNHDNDLCQQFMSVVTVTYFPTEAIRMTLPYHQRS